MNAVRRPIRLRLFAAVAAAVLPAVAGAGQLSWFDEPGRPGEARVRTGSLLNQDTRARFDLKLASLSESFADSDASELPHSTALRFYGGMGESLSAASSPETEFTRRGGVGLGLQHRLDARDSLLLSAEYGENLSPNVFEQDTADTRAVASYTRAFSHRWQPSLTGSVFLGDESARDESYRQLARRYLGLEVTGQVTLFKSHTPYLAFQMRRSYYDAPLAVSGGLPAEGWLSPRADDRSALTAGWRWQAGRDMSLQAEASYGLNNTGLDLYNPERSRVFFGTRFDFR
jgi:hypothetical protein